MRITLYEFYGDNRELDKNLVNGVTVACDVYGTNTLLSPSFLIDYRPEYNNKNYVFVEDWNRYYYISSPFTMMSGNRCVVNCVEDVRMTFASQIRNLECYIVRNENRCNTLIVDEFYPAEIMTTLCTLKFNATPFNPTAGDRNIVLAVYGGTQNLS